MIPDGWKDTTFLDLQKEGIILDIQDGNHGAIHPKSSDFVASGIPFIMANNLFEGKVDTVNSNKISRQQADSLRIGFAKTGDVLLSHKGSVGSVAIVPEVDPYIMLTPQVTYYRLDSGNSRLSSGFLFQYFQSPDFQKILEQYSKQSTRAYIGISAQKKLPILLPPLPEQKKIASILSSVDDAIQATQKVIDQTEKVKQGLLQELLTKGIGHTEFKKTEIGEIPVEWGLRTIKDLVQDIPNAITAGPFGTIFKAKDFRPTGIPIIQIRHITVGGFNWGKKTTFMDDDVYQKLHTSFKVKGGDLLLTKLGDPPGLACIYPNEAPIAMVTPDVIKATLNNQKVIPSFAMHMYNSKNTNERLLRLTKGGTRPRVTLNEFYALKIPYPPIREQIQISSILDNMDNNIALNRDKNTQLKQLKKGLMQDLLTGKVRVKV